MADEMEFIVGDVSQEDYELASAGFVTLPPVLENGRMRAPKVGDSIFLDIETNSEASWKTVNKSLVVEVTVTEKGENFGKKVEIYPGVSKDSLGLTKQLCKALGVEKQVITFNEKKQMVIRPKGFVGGKGVGKFVGTMTKPQEDNKEPTLIAKLSTADVYPVGYAKKSSGSSSSEKSEAKDIGI